MKVWNAVESRFLDETLCVKCGIPLEKSKTPDESNISKSLKNERYSDQDKKISEELQAEHEQQREREKIQEEEIYQKFKRDEKIRSYKASLAKPPKVEPKVEPEIEEFDENELDTDFEIPIPYISEDLETTIEINYNQKMKAKSRIFVSKKQPAKPLDDPLKQDRAEFRSQQIKAKDVTGYVGENWVRFKMDIKKFKTSHARWVYGGNYEIGTDDLPGYTLIVTFGSNEKNFKNLVIQALQKNGFGCLVGNTSASCHLREEYPTDEKARQVLENICRTVNSILYG